jgi:hypothetical protein
VAFSIRGDKLCSKLDATWMSISIVTELLIADIPGMVGKPHLSKHVCNTLHIVPFPLHPTTFWSGTTMTQSVLGEPTRFHFQDKHLSVIRGYSSV